MLSREDNELLCKVGPGTPTGALLRQYWIPALMSSELPERDGAPVRKGARSVSWAVAAVGASRRNARRSSSVTRTALPYLRAGSLPEAINRLTVRTLTRR